MAASFILFAIEAGPPCKQDYTTTTIRANFDALGEVMETLRETLLIPPPDSGGI